MIDNKGRIKGRISIIDIVLAVALLALVAGFVYRQIPRIQDILNPTTPLYVTIQGEGLRHFVTDAIEIGDVMFRSHVNQPLGTVVAIEIEPALDYLHRLDGTAVLAIMEERYTIRITLDAIGSITDRGFLVNGLDHMAVGSEIALISNRSFIPDGRVVAIGERSE